MKLTPEQRSAVMRSGQDVCVVAGPGSGKTRVLTERFRWRVEHGMSPLRILAVTFTEKAANELKQRLANEFRGQPGLREQIERAAVCTIDAFCAGLLREHAIAAGLDPEFQVLDATDAYAELWDAAEQALDELLAAEPAGVRSLLAALDLTDAVEALVRVHQAMRVTATGAREGAAARIDAGLQAVAELHAVLLQIAAADPAGGNDSQRAALEAVQDWARQVLAIAGAPLAREHFRVLNDFSVNLSKLRRNHPAYEHVRAVKNGLLDSARQALAASYYEAERALLWRAVELVDQAYTRRKDALNALDFADLEEHAIRLLRDNEPLRQRVRASFDEILMDELQDTNPLQASLLALLRRPDRFFAVGDINQSIYAFRHAEPETFRGFRQALEAEGRPVDKLYRNFRSRPDILYAAATVLNRADGIEVQRLEAARVFAHPNPDPAVEVIAALGGAMEQAAEIEARLVAQRIRELEGRLEIQEKDSGVVRPLRLSDIAILVRNVNALPAFEQALHRAGIPYLIARGKHFYEAREVTDLVHLLRVIVNPRDEVSLAAVLRSPLAGVGNETLFRLKETGNLGGAVSRLEHLDLSAFDPDDLARVRSFRDLLRELRRFADDLSPDRLLGRAIDASAYEAQLGPRARANVAKLLGRVRDWWNTRPRPLLELVHQLEFLRASDPDEPSAPPDEASAAVRMMTVHAAKGLEFPVVILAAMHKGISSESPALAFSPAAGLVARWLDPSSNEPVQDIAYAAFSEELKRRQMEEENRLLYVGMTRAEELLVLSFSHNGRGNPRNWAGRVTASLALELEADNVPAVIERQEPLAGRSFPLRFWCCDRAPEAAAFAAPASINAAYARPPRPAVSGQYSSSATVTDIALFAACPRRYYLARYLGWQASPSSRRVPEPEVDDETIDAGEFGREVHELLADISAPSASHQALELVARFRMSELGQRVSSADRVEREFDFAAAAGDTVLQGRIDLWFEQAGEIVLVDYKTDNVTAEQTAGRAAEYAVQMRLYAVALERFTGRMPSQALLYFLRPDVVVPVSLEAAGIAEAMQTVDRFRQAQEQLAFPPSAGDQCHRCAFYRGMCPVRE